MRSRSLTHPLEQRLARRLVARPIAGVRVRVGAREQLARNIVVAARPLDARSAAEHDVQLLVLPRTAAPLRVARHERVARSAAIAAQAERLQSERGAQREPVVRTADGGAGRNVLDPELLQNSSSCRAAATTR